jgi:hypothetical protein
MDACWAACLGDCSTKLSREHLVSESLFANSVVRVGGFPWCAGKSVEIGISGFTAKIRCEKHNNQLSPIDDAGADAFATLRKLTELSNIRGAMKPDIWKVKRFQISGYGLELWCLKTLINLSYGRGYPIGRDSPTADRPSDRLVRIAFGAQQFGNRAGLYFVVREGMKVTSDDTVSFLPLIKHGVHIEGGVFCFRGTMLLLFLEPEGPPQPLTGIVVDDEDLGLAQLNFHNEEIAVNVGKYKSHVLAIDWQ